jgi:nitroimidazol reductase NimA-like FMN-containing flavoprotein (pyridoxamine 5'-phosphate oxidase superfamily)
MAVVSSTDLDRAMWALRAYDTTALGTVSSHGPHVAGVFFAPELTESGRIHLLIATINSSRKQREMREDPRVAFMCSPGNPSRWVQGTGAAQVIDDEDRHHDLFRRLVSHAAGAQQFIERLPVTPAVITVQTLKVVEAAGSPALLLIFDELPPAG